VNVADVAVPDGYVVAAVAQGLNFPTAVTFDDSGGIYVLEAGYSYGEKFTTARLLKVGADGSLTPIVDGGENGPWTGVTWHDGRFYVAEGGATDGGRIVRYDADGGNRTVLVDGLPSLGDHHTDQLAFGPDGMLYFGQGTATNSGVVGKDSADFGWLKRHPDFHDVPCEDVRLTGVDYPTKDVLDEGRGKLRTGPYLPYGTPAKKGEIVEGNPRCNGSILRIPADGGEPEVVAWGFRNPFGIAFTPDGRLYTSVNGYDVRGSRPVYGAGDWLYEVTPGAWYGWPDWADGRPLSMKRYRAPHGPKLEPLIDPEPGTPPRPVAMFPVHSSADGMAVSTSKDFGHEGELFVAVFGDMAPPVGKTLAPVGYDVLRVDPSTGDVQEFLSNRGSAQGPASWLGTAGLERPVALGFSPDGKLYVVDFGQMLVDKDGPKPIENTGVLWTVSSKAPSDNRMVEKTP